VAQRIVRVDLDEASLGFGDDLLRHDDDIMVGEWPVRFPRARLDDEVTDLVARNDFADAGHAPRLQPRHDTASMQVRASAVVISGVDMIVLVTIQRMPSDSTAVASAASCSSMTSTEAIGAYSRATPTTLGS